MDGSGYIDPIALEDTFADLADHGVRLLLVLPEEQELPEGQLRPVARAIGGATGSRGCSCRWWIFTRPIAGFLQEWADLGPTLHRIMAKGDRIAACCQYGAGRSGLTAAWLLIEQGLDAPAAVALVRSHFEDAVESEAQLQFLQSRAPPAVGTTRGQHSHSNK